MCIRDSPARGRGRRGCPMTDRIVLQGIAARGFHGVLDVEKRDGQDFVVDVTLEVDLRRPGRSDLLAHTVNYAEVAADIVELITGPSLDLIETCLLYTSDAADDL